MFFSTGTSIWTLLGCSGTKYEVSNELIQPNGLMSLAQQSVSHSWARRALKAHHTLCSTSSRRCLIPDREEISMKSQMKKQRGNAFHRGSPQAKESYLPDTTLLHKNLLLAGALLTNTALYPIQRSAPQSLSKLSSDQISRC